MKNTNKFKALALTAILCFAAQTAKSQLEQSVYLNAGIPTSQFSSNPAIPATQPLMGREYIGTDATMGLGFGYRAGYIFNIGYGEVTPFLNADLFWNQLRSERRDNYATASIKTPQYFNIPLMLGVNYRYGLTDIITLFGELSVGYDIAIITSEGIKDNPLGFYRYKVGGANAWQIGAGSYFGNHFSISIHYYSLGKHTVNYNYDNSMAGTGVDPSYVTSHNPVLRKMGTFNIRLGFHF